MDWCFRLQWEQKQSYSSHFITLTYADEYLPIDVQTGQGTLCELDVRNFFKRLRKYNSKVQGKTIGIRFYYCGEYGTEGNRPHYHIILFNAKLKTIENLHKVWPIGQVDVGDVTPASIGYVTGYTINRAKDYGTLVPPYAGMSRRPGIGYNYLKSNAKWHKDESHPKYEQAMNRFFVLDNGHKRRLPRYYKDKIFTTGDKDAYNATLQPMRQEVYEREITRLAKLQENPEMYYFYAVREAHEAISRKNKKTKSL